LAGKLPEGVTWGPKQGYFKNVASVWAP
jgi:hypothetical protein